MNARSRHLLRTAVATIGAAVFVVMAFTSVGVGTPWRSALPAAGVALLFSICIGIPCSVLLPRIAPGLWRRLGFPWNWLALVLVMFSIAVPGSLLAIAILVLVGYVPQSQFVAWVVRSFRYSMITTLTFGIAISAYEMMRARLEQATLDLRTKERDEAEARRLAAEAQLASLESRVQPHFLFNTLNSIASLIPTDPKAAEQMTGRLASLLRSSLDDRRPLVRVDEEIAIVRDYLEIEQVRFGSRLRYTIDVDDGVSEVLVPRLALQTLVENAIKYAVAPRREGGTIAVRVAQAAGRVRVEVEDDGPGFDPAASANGHGLALARSRLALLYGERASLSIGSRPGRTVAAIELPNDSRVHP
jgi:sensor histidine kinase YesM